MTALSKMKICFLAGTLEHGGAERQLFYILQALRQIGANVRVLCLEKGGFWEEKIKGLDISVTWVGEEPKRLKRLRRILKEVRSDLPDIIQSQHFYVNAYAGIVARLVGAHGIGAMRSNGSVEARESGSIGGWLNLHCPQMLAANSKGALNYAVERRLPASKLFFLPNVVDTEHFKPVEAFQPAQFTLVAVGRLVSEKRFDRFLAIISRLRCMYHLDVRGIIVGGGCQDEDLRQDLEARASQLGLCPNSIEFLGELSDTSPVYQRASVCVLNSDYEGTPNVLLEAMASGLPVVASRVGGVPGIVRHGQTGFLFEPDDLDNFTKTLSELALKPALRIEMGRSARTFIEENHSLHRLPVFLENLYQQTLRFDRRSAIKFMLPRLPSNNSALPKRV